MHNYHHLFASELADIRRRELTRDADRHRPVRDRIRRNRRSR